MMRIATSQDLTRWYDNAHAKLDTTDDLTVDDLRALASTPERTGYHHDGRRTWWGEETDRIQREQVRDAFPNTGRAADVDAWNDRQRTRSEQIAALNDAHSEALVCAATHATKDRAAANRQKKRASIDAAIARGLGDAA